LSFASISFGKLKHGKLEVVHGGIFYRLGALKNRKPLTTETQRKNKERKAKSKNRRTRNFLNFAFVFDFLSFAFSLCLCVSVVNGFKGFKGFRIHPLSVQCQMNPCRSGILARHRAVENASILNQAPLSGRYARPTSFLRNNAPIFLLSLTGGRKDAAARIKV
jgi:hypothetical protein